MWSVWSYCHERKTKQIFGLGEYVCLLFKNLDSQMKQKIVWGIVFFWTALVFYTDGKKNKNKNESWKY